MEVPKYPQNKQFHGSGEGKAKTDALQTIVEMYKEQT